MAPGLAPGVCVITGASRGIGAQTARRFALAGYALVLAARDVVACEKLAAELRGTGAQACAVAVDVTDEQSVASLYATAVERFGRVDACVNNAGGIASGDTNPIDTPLDIWCSAIELNLTGTFVCIKHQLPYLVRAGSGAIVNVSGTAALLGSASPQIAYDAAKAGVLALTRDVAVAYAHAGIRCNAVCPGPITGELISGLMANDEAVENRLEHIPAGRFGREEEVAEAILFLASSTASWTTGATVPIDGGITIAYNTRP